MQESVVHRQKVIPLDDSYLSTKFEKMNRLKSILIIEDDEDHAFLEKDILEEDLQASIKIISSGKELDTVYLKMFDIVLLDFNLPDISGSQILKKIRSESDIPVILITGQNEINIAVNSLKEGADDFLVKSPEDNTLPGTSAVSLS